MRRSVIVNRLAGLIVCSALVACSPTPHDGADSARQATDRSAPISPAGPFIRVVGTVQDGGLPHIACTCERCERARYDPEHRRLVASLAIVLPESESVFLIDATPDVGPQLQLLADVRDAPAGRVDRAPVDGIFLTHAHVGHYLGLALFGYEAVHTVDMPVYGTARMLDFLRGNGPWNLLVERGNIELRELSPGGVVELGEGVTVEALAVPHRDEYTDTVGFLISGPNRRIFYVPDTDSWLAWQPPIEELLATVDLGIVDGTFFSADELPGRSIEAIGHPLIADSLERLTPIVEAGTRVAFTHFNHSNPVLDLDSTARARVEQLGFELLDDGDEIEL